MRAIYKGEVMNNLKYYDILGHLVPGLVFLSAVGFIWIQVGTELPKMPDGDGVRLLVMTALAYYVGHIISTIGSWIQPILYFLWLGKPSRRILVKETSHIHRDVRDRIRQRLAKECGLQMEVPECWRERSKYLDGLFSHASSICNRKNLGRVTEFNAKYALHRSLFVVSVLAGLISLCIIKVAKCGFSANFVRWLIFGYFVLAVISFFRARQRGYYFAREVLRMYQVGGG